MRSARGRQSSEQALFLSIVIGADLSAVAFIPHNVRVAFISSMYSCFVLHTNGTNTLQLFLIKFTKTSFPSPPTPVVSQAATMRSARGRQSSEQALFLSIVIGADLSAVAFIPHNVRVAFISSVYSCFVLHTNGTNTLQLFLIKFTKTSFPSPPTPV